MKEINLFLKSETQTKIALKNQKIRKIQEFIEGFQNIKKKINGMD